MSIITAEMARVIRSLIHASPVTVPQSEQFTSRQVYETMELYYLSNGVYAGLLEQLDALDPKVESMLDLRNPATAAIEFYPKKLWPGSLAESFKVETENPAIVEPVEQILKWSNWGQKKQLVARWFPMHGDLFLKVDTTVDPVSGKVTKVYIRPVHPKYITDFRVDENDHVIYLRKDVLLASASHEAQAEYRTEFWEKDVGLIAYHHSKGINAEREVIERDDPIEVVTMEEMGIDFLPWTHAPFIDIGQDENGTNRGLPLIWTAINQINNLDREATRLSQLMFRHGKPIVAILSNTVDESGRPVPAPKFKRDGESNLALAANRLAATGFRDDDVLELPGKSTVEFLIANLPYDQFLRKLDAELIAVRGKLPELWYYEVIKESGLSGIALRLKMQPAVDRAMEIRATGYQLIARTVQMALTIGKMEELFGEGIGTFHNGDFEHTYKGPEMFPLTEEERQKLVDGYVKSGVPIRIALVRYGGWTETEAAKVPEGATAVPVAQNAAQQEELSQDVLREIGIQRNADKLEDGLVSSLLNQAAKRLPSVEDIKELVTAEKARRGGG